MVTRDTITSEQIAQVRARAVDEGDEAIVAFCDRTDNKARQFVVDAYNRWFPDPPPEEPPVP